jgi:hypothetical protein
MFKQEWQIKQRSSVCKKCNKNFNDGEDFVSALCENSQSPDEYIREDICLNCWLNKEAQEKFYSVWRSTYVLPPPPPPEPLKKETAESLLRKMIEKKDSSLVNVIFILAIMLERKRLLVERDIKRSKQGNIIRIYEHKKTGETFIIEDPQLSLERIQEIQAEVISMLSYENALEAVPISSSPLVNETSHLSASAPTENTNETTPQKLS